MDTNANILVMTFDLQRGSLLHGLLKDHFDSQNNGIHHLKHILEDEEPDNLMKKIDKIKKTYESQKSISNPEMLKRILDSLIKIQLESKFKPDFESFEQDEQESDSDEEQKKEDPEALPPMNEDKLSVITQETESDLEDQLGGSDEEDSEVSLFHRNKHDIRKFNLNGPQTLPEAESHAIRKSIVKYVSSRDDLDTVYKDLVKDKDGNVLIDTIELVINNRVKDFPRMGEIFVSVNTWKKIVKSIHGQSKSPLMLGHIVSPTDQTKKLYYLPQIYMGHPVPSTELDNDEVALPKSFDATWKTSHVDVALRTVIVRALDTITAQIRYDQKDEYSTDYTSMLKRALPYGLIGVDSTVIVDVGNELDTEIKQDLTIVSLEPKYMYGRITTDTKVMLQGETDLDSELSLDQSGGSSNDFDELVKIYPHGQEDLEKHLIWFHPIYQKTGENESGFVEESYELLRDLQLDHEDIVEIIECIREKPIETFTKKLSDTIQSKSVHINEDASMPASFVRLLLDMYISNYYDDIDNITPQAVTLINSSDEKRSKLAGNLIKEMRNVEEISGRLDRTNSKLVGFWLALKTRMTTLEDM